jgi:hypothetical protein
MEIVSIFDNKLLSFHYENESQNEYDRLMENWTDVEFVKEFATKNSLKDIPNFVKGILRDAEKIQNLVEEITSTDRMLEEYFTPLNDLEIGIRILSMQKGKLKSWTHLRIYAIKIDKNCFLITGGAIKITNRMDGHNDTLDELKKLEKAKLYLQYHNIINIDSFQELLDE